MRSFSSGEVAKICDVTARTVIRWIGAGRLNAFKLPGRGNNRISESDLLSFLSQNNMPIPPEIEPVDDKVCVIVTDDQYLLKHAKRIARDANFMVSTFNNSIEAGFEIAFKKPALLVLDADLANADPHQIRDQIERSIDYHPDFIIFASTASARNTSSVDTKMSVLAKPFSMNEFASTLEHKLLHLS